MFLVVCLNPTLQRTVVLPSFHVGEVNRAAEARLDASGKGVNVARVLMQLGAEALHLTHCGGEQGREFLRYCRADGLAVEAVEAPAEPRTCITLIEESAGVVTEVIEPATAVDTETVAAIRAAFARLLPAAHTVVVTGTVAPGYPETILAELGREARAAGATVIADLRGAALKAALNAPRALQPTVIKPNLSEFVATFLPKRGAISEHTDDPLLLEEVENQLRAIAAAGAAVVLTRGAQPTLYLRDAGEADAAGGAGDGVGRHAVLRRAVLPVAVRNTIGCGDAFAAGLAYELHESGDFERALERAHTCAAMNAGLLKPGSIRPE